MFLWSDIRTTFAEQIDTFYIASGRVGLTEIETLCPQASSLTRFANMLLTAIWEPGPVARTLDLLMWLLGLPQQYGMLSPIVSLPRGRKWNGKLTVS